MTDKTQTPSDAEIIELALYLCAFARSVLARWGTPAAPSRFGSPELQAMILARCKAKDQAAHTKETP